jgi:chromosome partitioning protein
MHVISFVNMKGGVGKTTLAVNVADALNRRHDRRVLIVDIDPQFNATQCLYTGEEYLDLRKDGGQTIADIFTDTSKHTIDAIGGPQEIKPPSLSEITPWSYREGLDIIPGNLEIYKMDMGHGQGRELRLKRYLKQKTISDNYDYTIIDTPPTPSHYMNAALLASQHYLVPVKPEPLSRVGIDLLRDVVGRISENHAHEIECLGAVITMADLRTKVYFDSLKFLDNDAFWSDKKFQAPLPHRTAIAREQGNQQLILDTNQQDAKSALVRITNELRERLGDADA